MASKELFAQVEQIIWRDRARVIPSRSADLANEILAPILAALQEPTEEMIDVVPVPYRCGRDWRQDAKATYRAMLAASALGEQSE